MSVDPRDELWQVSFETTYDAYYEESAADLLIDRWQLLDEITKVMVALTASGSAVAGWALWNQPHFKTLWAILAGSGALLAIFHTALGVATRLKDWSAIKVHFASLRVDLETLRYGMQVDPEFPVDEFKRKFLEYRERYRQGVQRLKNDILLTGRLRNRAQDQLNQRLRGSIIEE